MASTATPAKSGSTLLAAQTISNTIIKGTPVDVSTKWGMTLKVRMGRTTTTSLGAAVEYRLEGSAAAHAGADDMWVPIVAWTTANHLTAAVAPTLAATQAAAATIFTLSSGTGVTAADSLLFLYDGGAAGVVNSEWTRIVSISGANVTVSDSLTRAHSLTTTIVTDQAEEWSVNNIDLSSERSVRFVADAAKNAVTVTTVVQAMGVFFDATAAT